MKLSLEFLLIFFLGAATGYGMAFVFFHENLLPERKPLTLSAYATQHYEYEIPDGAKTIVIELRATGGGRPD